MDVYLAVAGDVFDGVLFHVVHFPDGMSWMTSGTELGRFLRLYLPSLTGDTSYRW